MVSGWHPPRNLMKVTPSTFFFLLASLPLFLLAVPRATAADVWLSSLGTDGIEQEWGTPRTDKSVDNHSLRLGGTIYAHGLGTHAGSTVEVALAGGGERFDSTVGVDDEVGARGDVTFRVEADGKEVYNSGPLKGGDAPRAVSVDLTGVKTLLLLADAVGDSIDSDHADWAAA